MYKADKNQIEAWKNKHGRIHTLTAKDEDKRAYVRKPTRKELSFLSTVKDPIKFNESLLKTCWLEGDMEIQTDDHIFLGLSEEIAGLMTFAEVKLEKI